MNGYPEFTGFDPGLPPKEGITAWRNTPPPTGASAPSGVPTVRTDRAGGLSAAEIYAEREAAAKAADNLRQQQGQWQRNLASDPFGVKATSYPGLTPAATQPQSTPPAAQPSTQKATTSGWKSGVASVLGGVGGGWVGQKIGDQVGAPEAGMTIGSGIGAIGGAALAGGPRAALRYGVGPIAGSFGGGALGQDIGGAFGSQDQGAQIGTIVGGLAGLSPAMAATLGGYGAGRGLNAVTANDSTGGLGIGDALIRGMADLTGSDALKRFADSNENRVASERSTRLNADPFLKALNDPQKRMEVLGIAQKHGGPGTQFAGILQQWFGSKEGQAWLGSEEGRKWAASPSGVSLFGQQAQQNAPGGVPVPQWAAVQANQPGATGPQSGATVHQGATATAANPGLTSTITSDANGNIRLGLTQPGTKGTGTIEIPEGQSGEPLDRAIRMAEGQRWLQRTGGNTFKNAAALAGDSGFATANTPSGELLRYGGGATRLADGTIWSPEIAAARQRAANEGRWGDVNRSLGLAQPQSRSSSAPAAQPQTLAEMLHGPAQGGGDFIAKANMRHQIENALNEMTQQGRGGSQVAQAYANLLGQSRGGGQTGGGGQTATRPDHALQLEDMRHQKALELERLRQSGALTNEQFKSQLALQNGLALEQAKLHPELKLLPQYDKMGIQTGVLTAAFDPRNSGLREIQAQPVGKGQSNQGAQAAAQNKQLYERLSPKFQAWWDQQREAGNDDATIADYVRSQLPK